MLILASASKARRHLLEQVNIEHEVILNDVDENEFNHSNPYALVKILATAKAESASLKLLDQNRDAKYIEDISAILGCDSLFEFQGEIFGKPVDYEQARSRWERFSGKSGILHTGHCLLFNEHLLNNQKEITFGCCIAAVITTKIYFAKLTLREIDEYVSTGEPINCAGGFAIDGKAGPFITKIEGCYSNVIGLSLPWLRQTYVNVGLQIKSPRKLS